MSDGFRHMVAWIANRQMGGMTSPRRVPARLVGTRGSLNERKRPLEPRIRQLRGEILFNESIERNSIPRERLCLRGSKLRGVRRKSTPSGPKKKRSRNRRTCMRSQLYENQRRQKRSPKGGSSKGGSQCTTLNNEEKPVIEAEERGMETKNR